MPVLQAPPAKLDTRVAQLQRANRGLIGATVVLAAALIALGTWFFVGSSDTAATDLPQGALETLNAARQMTNAPYDTETMLDYVTEDFTFQSYGEVASLAQYQAYINQYYENVNFNIASTGDPVAVGEGDTYIVSEPGLVTWNGNPGVQGFSVSTLVESDGTWLIKQIRWIGEDPPNHIHVTAEEVNAALECGHNWPRQTRTDHSFTIKNAI